MQRNKAGTFLPQLTGIRCFAASLVLLLHAGQAVGLTSLPIISRGDLGVDLFFLLSGYIIAHVYAANFQRSSMQEFGRFMWHRFARLYPAHIAVLMMMAVGLALATRFNLPLDDRDAFTAKNFIKAVFLVQAWGTDLHIGWNAVSWSVSAEWFAYLLFPAIAFFILRCSRPVAALTAALALAGMAAAFNYFDWTLSAWVGPPALTRVTSEFLCGVAMWRAAPQFSFSSRVIDSFGFAAMAVFLLGAAFGLSDFSLIALLAVLILATARSDGVLRRAFAVRPAVWLGEISYSLYLVHFTVVRSLHKILVHFLVDYSPVTKVAMFVLSYPCSVVAAVLLYYVVEKPARTALVDGLRTRPPAPVLAK
jgi:peptidoglycan/LPS O-acetylase OafA/YrhL